MDMVAIFADTGMAQAWLSYNPPDGSPDLIFSTSTLTYHRFEISTTGVCEENKNVCAPLGSTRRKKSMKAEIKIYKMHVH